MLVGRTFRMSMATAWVSRFCEAVVVRFLRPWRQTRVKHVSAKMARNADRGCGAKRRDQRQHSRSAMPPPCTDPQRGGGQYAEERATERQVAVKLDTLRIGSHGQQ
jgi:hypothetical protein